MTSCGRRAVREPPLRGSGREWIGVCGRLIDARWRPSSPGCPIKSGMTGEFPSCPPNFPVVAAKHVARWEREPRRWNQSDSSTSGRRAVREPRRLRTPYRRSPAPLIPWMPDQVGHDGGSVMPTQFSRRCREACRRARLDPWPDSSTSPSPGASSRMTSCGRRAVREPPLRGSGREWTGVCGRCLYLPASPVSAIPRTKYFWAEKNKARIGMSITTPDAINMFQRSSPGLCWASSYRK